MRQSIQIILDEIRESFPCDFQRIHQRVEGFEPLRRTADGTEGEWVASKGGAIMYDFESSGVIRLLEKLDSPVAVIAHELGHVCTREEDFTRRDGFDSAWASELCADYYAYKWGFGRAIARHRPFRDLSHHGPAPNQVFTIEDSHAGRVHRYRVTRHFYIRPLS